MTYSSELPGFIMSSVPKSGTHLLLQILRGIPQVKVNIPFMYYKTNSVGYDQEQLSLLEIYLKNLESYDGVFGHLHFSKSIQNLLNKHNMKHIFIYRDPRDVLISYMNHATKFGDQTLSDTLIKCNTIEEKVAAVLTGNNEQPSFKEIFSPYYKWLGYKHPDFFAISYESIVLEESREETIFNLIDFLLNNKTFNELQELTKLAMKAIDPSSCPTFHSGKIGQWKLLFNEEIKKIFKCYTEDLLLETKYELTNNW